VPTLRPNADSAIDANVRIGPLAAALIDPARQFHTKERPPRETSHVDLLGYRQSIVQPRHLDIGWT
jgi:hypothetical protein